ncbi:hypothetical protein WJX79_000524 [Trebouxia sp. C0005]
MHPKPRGRIAVRCQLQAQHQQQSLQFQHKAHNRLAMRQQLLYGSAKTPQPPQRIVLLRTLIICTRLYWK